MDQEVRVEGITVTNVQELITTTVVCHVVSDATFWSDDPEETIIGEARTNDTQGE